MSALAALPTIFDPKDEQATDVVVGASRVWTSTRLDARQARIIPDLSQDVLLLQGRVFVVPRTTHAAEVAVAAGPVAGVRLPMAAVGVSVDRRWAGWKLRTADPEGAQEVLASAVEAGAVSWTLDQRLETLLRLAGERDVRIGGIAHGLSMSERTLRRFCLGSFGAQPSRVIRVLRLWRLFAAVRVMPAAMAASAVGYADQAHASRDVTALTGYRLKELARMELAE